MRKLTKHLQYSFKENLPWWCMVELGRKLVFLLLLIPFPQNTVSFIVVILNQLSSLKYACMHTSKFSHILQKPSLMAHEYWLELLNLG